MKTTKSLGQRIHEQIKAAYPDVYLVAGVGYCGPDWQKAEAMRKARLAEQEAP